MLEQAVRLHRGGRLSEAAAAYQQVLEVLPGNSFALHMRGVALLQMGDAAAAAPLIGRAAAAEPRNAEVHANLGAALMALGDLDGALKACRKAVKLAPNHAQSHYNLGNALKRLGDPAGAVPCYKKATSLHSGYVEAFCNLGSALRELGRREEAETALKRALALRPDLPEAHNTLGCVLREMGQLAEAQASLGRALALRPDFAEAHNNLGNALKEAGQYAAALAAYGRALALRPDYAEARWNLAVSQLLTGAETEGWPAFEGRWNHPETAPRRLDGPLWDGRPLPGTLLVHCEQGLGDSIQFARLLPLAAARVGRLVLAVQPPLVELLRGLPGIEVTTPEALPAFDAYAALLSLPGLLGARLANRPAGLADLAADPAKVADWRRFLAEKAGTRLTVGLVWAGNPKHHNDRNRSIKASMLEPVLETPGVAFFSLQIGRLGELGRLRTRAVDLGPRLKDFSDTAAALTALDLCITVDTSVAHLAGALGRPAWVLLPFDPDWRWGVSGASNSWCPSLRLFRQAGPGDWGPVLDEVAAALRERAGCP